MLRHIMPTGADTVSKLWGYHFHNSSDLDAVWRESESEGKRESVVDRVRPE